MLGLDSIIENIFKLFKGLFKNECLIIIYLVKWILLVVVDLCC